MLPLQELITLEQETTVLVVGALVQETLRFQLVLL